MSHFEKRDGELAFSVLWEILRWPEVYSWKRSSWLCWDSSSTILSITRGRCGKPLHLSTPTRADFLPCLFLLYLRSPFCCHPPLIFSSGPISRLSASKTAAKIIFFLPCDFSYFRHFVTVVENPLMKILAVGLSFIMFQNKDIFPLSIRHFYFHFFRLNYGRWVWPLLQVTDVLFLWVSTLSCTHVSLLEKTTSEAYSHRPPALNLWYSFTIREFSGWIQAESSEAS